MDIKNTSNIPTFVFDYDATLMYPTEMISMNHGNTAFSPQIKYYVSSNYPFEIKTMFQHTDTMSYLKEDIDTILYSTPFKRKFDAEYHKLELLSEYYKKLGDNIKVERYDNEKSQLAENHPEWLI